MTLMKIRDVEINIERLGPESAPVLLALHGFTGTAKTWHPLLDDIARDRSILAVDALGHGASDAPTDSSRYAVTEAVRDLAAILERLGIPSIDLLGYSMGGRVALEFALTYPERTNSLILESASPGIVDSADRKARRFADESLANIAETQGIVAFVDRWERAPIFASQRSMPEASRITLRADRIAQSAFGLANSLLGAGQGVAPEAWSRLATLTMPVHLIVGSLDEKYVGIGREMAGRLPTSRLTIVPGAGHAVHIEAPEEFLRCVMSSLEVPRAASLG